jgi:hypothetical protein
MPDTPDSSDSANMFGSRLKMPTFSGSSSEHITQWLKVFDKWCVLCNYSEAQKPSLLSFVFTGSAAKILAAWDATGSIPNTWTDVKAKVITQFSDSSRVKVYEATLLRRKLLPSETFDEYFAEILSLCSSVKHDMPENEKIQHLLKGLPETIVQFLIFKDPQTTDDVLKAYSSYKTAKLLTSPLSEASEQAIAAPAITDNITSALVSKFESLMACQNEKIAELQALVVKNQPEQRCFRCHQTGHQVKDCPMPKSPQPAPRARNEKRDMDRQDRYPTRRSYSPHHPNYSRNRTPSPHRFRYDNQRRSPSPSPYHRRHPEERKTPPPSRDYYDRDSRYPDRSYYNSRSSSPGHFRSSRDHSDYYYSSQKYSEN